MATIFKTLLKNDVVSTKTLLHEKVPITGSTVSGTYGTFPNDSNIKDYAHGLFQSVYDFPHLSSSANHIFDISVGYSTGTVSVSGTAVDADAIQISEKVNIYNQMAQVLQGHDANGKISRFDVFSEIFSPALDATKLDNVFFINFARLLGKDEIKKGSFTLKLGVGTTLTAPFAGTLLTIQDNEAWLDYRVNSPAGEYGLLKATNGYNTELTGSIVCGLIFYQAGVVVLSGSVFMSGSSENNGSENRGAGAGMLTASVSMSRDNTYNTWLTGGFSAVLATSSISGACNEIRRRIYDISFDNTSELNSVIHFCRINHNEFNYSSNPSYLSSGKIVTKNNALDAPVSLITGIGLYSADNELLAVAKLSNPLLNSATKEMAIQVRLDY